MANNFETLSSILQASIPTATEGSDGKILPTTSTLEGIRLFAENEEREFVVLPWNPAVSSKPPLSSVTFKESMYNGCIFGSIVLHDIRNWVDEFLFTGNEKIEIKFKIGSSPELVTMTFHIYDARLVTDDAYTGLLTTADERVSLWRLEFVSSKIFLPNYNQTILEENEDFVGKLSGDDDSLVNTIFNKLEFEVNKIDDSKPGIWLKNDHISYPWMKFKGQVRIPQLLNYLANHAWDGNFSKFHADYYFWEDRDGWNFRSITKMLKPEGKNVSPSDGFLVTIDKFNPKRILRLQVLSEYNIQKLLDTYALFSFYDRFDPNYDNPYLDFLDTNDSFKKKSIVYNYHESYDHMVQIDDKKLISDDFKTDIKTENGKIKQSARIDDEIYGYYTKTFMNTPTLVDWDTYGRGKSGSTPWIDKAWQPQYDLTELAFDKFKLIHENIRKPLIQKRAEYARKKNIKRKWEVYRCTVCCHENGALGSPEDIFAIQNPGPTGGITYQALFGPDGRFASKEKTEYNIVAAGSLTDLLNYDIGNTRSERGLTSSYDLTKDPYNQNIGQFYNLTGPEVPQAYSQHVIQRATNLYNILITKIDSRISQINSFLANVQSYKNTADQLYESVLLDKVSNIERPIDLTQGFRYVGDAIVGEVIDDWPITPMEFGMVPQTKIPPQKGVGQVVFGTRPPASLSQTLRFAPLGSPNSATQNGDSIPSCDACCVQLCAYGELPEDCTDLLGCNYLECLAGCNPDGSYIDPNQQPQFRSGSGNVCLCCQTLCNPAYEGLVSPICNEFNCAICDQDNSTSPPSPPPDGTSSPPPPDEGGGGGGDGGGGGGGGGIPGPPGPRGPTGPTGPTGATGPTGPSSLPSPEDLRYIPVGAYSACSNDPVIRGYIRYYENASNYSPIYLYAAPYLWDMYDSAPIKDWSFFDYGRESGLFPAIADVSTVITTVNCLQGNGCYNTTCLSSNALEALRRTVTAEKVLLQTERTLIEQLKTRIEQTYAITWQTRYREWYERSSFFFSKQPGKSIFKDATTNRPTVRSPLSLQNIKRITRKEVRGSRYELLSRQVGLTGAVTGQWLYNIFFGNDQGASGHPYYNQKYNSNGFIGSRRSHAWYQVSDSDATDDPNGPAIAPGQFTQYGPQYKGSEFVESSSFHVARESIPSSLITSSIQPTALYGSAQSDLPINTPQFRNTFNFYNLNQTIKPPNIKKEEISSYVRVEFINPIGLDTAQEFSNGFVRDAGVEYFLPYIVNLTVGPMGRQGVKYNAAVIGMDPYGFDVAVKKIKDDLPVNRKLQGVDKGNYYDWWNHDTGAVLSKTPYLTTDYNGMDLWPEPGFETEFPYYAFDPMQEDLHGGGYDMDFHMGGAYYFENESQDWMESLYHYGMSSGKQFDPLYRTSVLGSYILPNSYRKLKPHRSWWSFFVPRNLFIPIRFANMFKSPNTKARDMFGGKALFTISPNYWRSWYGSEFETWLGLNSNNSELRSLLQSSGLNYYIEGLQGDSISPHDGDNPVTGYFKDSLMHYLAGNYILYRPSLVKEDLWKYDLSGETDYGLITPPVDTEYDFFDRNFALQFTVFARGQDLTCKDLGLQCLNPKGLVGSAGGCTFSPYCNCPARNLLPGEPEPTYIELYKLKTEINECKLIEETLDRSWLGCDLHNPNSTISCNCPEYGENYKNYIAYARTYATFWETPHSLPLVRLAQLSQLDSQKLIISIAPSEKVKIGSLVEVINFNDNPELTENEFKRISGKWLVTEIEHIMMGIAAYYTNVTLVRNSLHYDPNDGKTPNAIFNE